MNRLIDFLLSFSGPAPYWVVFGILLLCGLGIPIPEDITLIAAGAMVYYGTANLWVMIAVSFFGVMLGDAFIFFLGAKYGRRLTKKWIFHKLLPDDRLDRVQKKFNEKGEKLLFFARFMPGLRAPIYFSAGTLHIPFKVFLFYDGLAALISVPAIVWCTYYFGDDLDRVVHLIQRVERGILAVILLVLAFAFWKWRRSRKP
jgi:membrane protein DedA with SNARE-associated domain